jgi:hypothetical protein
MHLRKNLFMHARGGKHATLVSLAMILACILQLKRVSTEMTPEERRRIEAMREAPISAGNANMDGDSEWQDINIHDVLDGTIPLDISHAGGEFAALSDAIRSDMTKK